MVAEPAELALVHQVDQPTHQVDQLAHQVNDVTTDRQITTPYRILVDVVDV